MFVSGEGNAQELDSDFPAQLDVFGQIDFAHPTFAELGPHFVAAEASAGGN